LHAITQRVPDAGGELLQAAFYGRISAGWKRVRRVLFQCFHDMPEKGEEKMRRLIGRMVERWRSFYRRSSIQMILSLSFTAVAVTGMVFLGLSLFLRFSVSTNHQLAESSERVMAQVNLHLDSYLRSMMRMSDTAYYRVIKRIDLETDTIDTELNLLYVDCGFFSKGGAGFGCPSFHPEKQHFPAVAGVVPLRAGKDREPAFFHPACSEPV